MCVCPKEPPPAEYVAKPITPLHNAIRCSPIGGECETGEPCAVYWLDSRSIGSVKVYHLKTAQPVNLWCWEGSCCSLILGEVLKVSSNLGEMVEVTSPYESRM